MKCYEISSGQDSSKITRTFQVICTISDGLRKEIVEGELEQDYRQKPQRNNRGRFSSYGQGRDTDYQGRGNYYRGGKTHMIKMNQSVVDVNNQGTWHMVVG